MRRRVTYTISLNLYKVLLLLICFKLVINQIDKIMLILKFIFFIQKIFSMLYVNLKLT